MLLPDGNRGTGLFGLTSLRRWFRYFVIGSERPLGLLVQLNSLPVRCRRPTLNPNFLMYSRLLAAASVLSAFFFSGCATELGMARLDNPEAISKSTRPVYLMTVTLKNSLVPAYQPKLVA